MFGNYFFRRKFNINGVWSFFVGFIIEFKKLMCWILCWFFGIIVGNLLISYYELIISKVLENFFDFVNFWFWKVKNVFLLVGGYYWNLEFIRLKDYNKFWVIVLCNNIK